MPGLDLINQCVRKVHHVVSPCNRTELRPQFEGGGQGRHVVPELVGAANPPDAGTGSVNRAQDLCDSCHGARRPWPCTSHLCGLVRPPYGERRRRPRWGAAGGGRQRHTLEPVGGVRPVGEPVMKATYRTFVLAGRKRCASVMTSLRVRPRG